jgi:hypothetical protein
MSKFIFKGDYNELEEKLIKLIQFQIDIERWYVINVEIATDYDINYKNFKEENVISHSEFLYKIIMEVLSGDEDSAWKYYREYEKI